MDRYVAVFRDAEGLEQAHETVRRLKEQAADAGIDDKGSVFNYDLTEALELEHLLDLAEVLVVGAQARTESRGAHWRDDFPTRDDANWMKHTLAWRDASGEITLGYKPVVQGRYEPMERKY
jgi:succinate dehydrogenase / fumarate reductase flavoprotein subunit